jgi:hypothetical protein
MIVGERDDRIVVGEIVVKRQLKLHTRAVDEIPEKLILCSIANRQQDLYIVGRRLPRAIKYHDRDDPFTWIDCWIHRDGAVAAFTFAMSLASWSASESTAHTIQLYVRTRGRVSRE